MAYPYYLAALPNEVDICQGAGCGNVFPTVEFRRRTLGIVEKRKSDFVLSYDGFNRFPVLTKHTYSHDFDVLCLIPRSQSKEVGDFRLAAPAQIREPDEDAFCLHQFGKRE